jgi:hypothetical protein
MASEFRYFPKGNFITRYAKMINEKASLDVANEKEEFQSGYEKGSLNYTIATKYLGLKHCGLDRYLEEDNNCIWERKGDSLIRIDSDTSWIDELLTQEGNR